MIVQFTVSSSFTPRVVSDAKVKLWRGRVWEDDSKRAALWMLATTAVARNVWERTTVLVPSVCVMVPFAATSTRPSPEPVISPSNVVSDVVVSVALLESARKLAPGAGRGVDVELLDEPVGPVDRQVVGPLGDQRPAPVHVRLEDLDVSGDPGLGAGSPRYVGAGRVADLVPAGGRPDPLQAVRLLASTRA